MRFQTTPSAAPAGAAWARSRKVKPRLNEQAMKHRQQKPDIVLFDLDHTLLAGDSDFAWGCFLAKVGAVDKHYRERITHYYQLYLAQELDIHDYIRFALQPLSEHSMKQLLAWRQEFTATVIQPMISAAAYELVNKHQAQRHITIIITATNRFVVEPIAELFSVPHLIATEIEEKNGAFTGAIAGVPCFQDGKVTRFRQWLRERGQRYASSWFYSDSINDLPLLNHVDKAIVVDGDDELRRHAQSKNWPCISLRPNKFLNNKE